MVIGVDNKVADRNPLALQNEPANKVGSNELHLTVQPSNPDGPLGKRVQAAIGIGGAE